MARGERGTGEQPHKCSEGRESRTTLRAATVVVFSPPRALFVCAQEPLKEPAQSCAKVEVLQRSVRKFGGRTGSGFLRWNSESRRWNEPLLKNLLNLQGKFYFCWFFAGLVSLSRWITGRILPKWTNCDGFVKPGFHSALPGCLTPTHGPIAPHLPGNEADSPVKALSVEVV